MFTLSEYHLLLTLPHILFKSLKTALSYPSIYIYIYIYIQAFIQALLSTANFSPRLSFFTVY